MSAPLQWHAVAQFMGTVNARGRTLVLIVQDLSGAWNVGAIETVEALPTVRAEDVFDDHAHKVVGRYKTPAEAFRAAESFATAWVNDHKSTRTEQCGCDEIKDGGS